MPEVSREETKVTWMILGLNVHGWLLVTGVRNNSKEQEELGCVLQ